MGGSVALVLGCLAPLAGGSADDKLDDELKKLEGTWVLVSTEQDGGKKPAAPEKWVFAGDRAKVHVETKPANAGKDWTFAPKPANHLLTYRFQLDPAADPKTLDQYTEFKAGKDPVRGLYVLPGPGGRQGPGPRAVRAAWPWWPASRGPTP